jgi:hypothetical protein
MIPAIGRYWAFADKTFLIHGFKSTSRFAPNARHHPTRRAVITGKFSIGATLFAVGCIGLLGSPRDVIFQAALRLDFSTYANAAQS